jgi:hypothetical protein
MRGYRDHDHINSGSRFDTEEIMLPDCLTSRSRCWLRITQAALALAGIALLTPAWALEPQTPVTIVTPDHPLARELGIELAQGNAPAALIFVDRAEVVDVQIRRELVHHGETVKTTELEPALEPARLEGFIEQPLPSLVESYRGLEPGIYAESITIVARLEGADAAPLVEQAWLRFRTDGERFEFLELERYSAAIEQAEASVAPDGSPALVLRGTDVKTDDSGSGRPGFDRPIGPQGAVPEQPVKLRDVERERFIDEGRED